MQWFCVRQSVIVASKSAEGVSTFEIVASKAMHLGDSVFFFFFENVKFLPSMITNKIVFYNY